MVSHESQTLSDLLKEVHAALHTASLLQRRMQVRRAIRSAADVGKENVRGIRIMVGRLRARQDGIECVGVVEMFKLTAARLFVLSAMTILATLINVALVILSEPPAFMGYFFGALNGANWILLLVLYAHYWEDT